MQFSRAARGAIQMRTAGIEMEGDESVKRQYVQAYYSTYVDSMLARQAQAGQGGQLECSPVEVHRALFRLTNSCYSFLVTEMANALGMGETKAIVKRAISNLGRYSGDRVRLRVQGRGDPLDVENLLKPAHGVDLEDIHDRKGNFVRMPHYYSYDQYGCPTWDQYSRLCPRELAILTCEDIHVAMCQGYNPNIDQWFNSLLPKGQGHCGFKWVMSSRAAEEALDEARRYRERAAREGRALDEPVPQGPLDSAAVYRSLVGMWVYKYHFPIDELLRTMAEDSVEGLVRRAMRKWGTWRGDMMRKDHERRGWPLDVMHLITYYDDPAAGDAWTAENVVLTETAHERDVTDSALTDAFQEVGSGRFALPPFEEAIPALAKAYNPAMRVTIPTLMERGDRVSRLEIRVSG